MIPVSDVIDAVLVVLRGELPLVGDHTAPVGNPAVYAVLESPPGSTLTGTVTVPEDGMMLVVRVRAVARTTSRTTARQAAQDTARRLAAALLDRSVPISGEGWAVVGRTHLSSAGIDAQGDVVNVIDDYELWVSR